MSAENLSFARDLKKIRIKRGYSEEDISNYTRNTIDIIQLFEEDGLTNHPRFNKIYLRALVKGYSETINIDSELALRALEDTLTGRYNGELEAVYLQGKPHGKVPDTNLIEEKYPEIVEQPLPVSTQVTKEEVSTPEAKPEKKEKPLKKESKSEPKKPKIEEIAAPESEEVEKTPLAEAITKEPTAVESVLEMDMVEEDPIPKAIPEEPDVVEQVKEVTKKEYPQSEKSKERKSIVIDDFTSGPDVKIPDRVVRSRQRKKSNIPTKSLLMTLGAVVIGVVIIWFVLKWFWTDTPNEEDIYRDEGTSQQIVEQTEQEMPPVVLPDSLKLVLIADGGTLSPVDEIRNGEVEAKHWVELNDSTVIYFTDEITLAARPHTIPFMKITIQDRLWEERMVDSVGTMTITREKVEQLFNQ